MAVWKCKNCGTIKESRCKPKKCPNCGEADTMIKEGTSEGESGGKGGRKSTCKRCV